jgi:hypothetical protein
MTRFRFAFAVALLATLGACSTLDPLGPRDFRGFAYPGDCAGDLAGVGPEPVFVSRAELHAVIDSITKLRAKRSNRAMDGLYTKAFGKPQIFINKALTGPARADVLRHERCHYIMDQLTGSPYWHD